MRRRTLMDLICRGDSMIKYGYFDVKPEIESQTWQVNITDFKLEVQTGLSAAPKKFLCVYVDNKEVSNTNGVSIFSGNASGNGYTGTVSNMNVGRAESVSFLSPDALYTRYDESTSILYLHVAQWGYVKCGRWMWIAIYDEYEVDAMKITNIILTDRQTDKHKPGLKTCQAPEVMLCHF